MAALTGTAVSNNSNNSGYQPLPGWDPNAPDILPIGTRVKIRHFFGHKGRVVAWRGPLAPGGVQVYRVRYGKGRGQAFELRRDQLVVLPPKAAGPAAPPPADPPSPDPQPA